MNQVTPKIEVCFGPDCSDKGSRELAKELEALGHTIVMGDCWKKWKKGSEPFSCNMLIQKVKNRKLVEASMYLTGFPPSRE